MKVRYEWTGEYRPPLKNEWHLKYNQSAPFVAVTDGVKEHYWILRRVETAEPSQGKEE